MAGEDISTRVDESTEAAPSGEETFTFQDLAAEAAPSEGDEPVTFENLGSTEFSGTAVTLQDGETTAESADDMNEEQVQDPEQSSDTGEQKQDGEDDGKQQTPEKSRAEQRLDAVKEKLENIERELSGARENKEKIEEEIASCEAAIEDNAEQHNQLSDKVNELKLEIKRTKRNIISGFTNGLKIAKNLALGRHAEARKILDGISTNVDANEKAMGEHEEAAGALEANETERITLDGAYADAVDRRSACDSKISRLERQREEAARQVEMLKEEVANEAWSEAWKDAQEGIKAEMGTDNMTAFRRELDAQEKELDQGFEEDLAELETYRKPSRIQRLMRSEEELRRDSERAAEVEEILTREHDSAAAVIDSKREKVDRYFPTWHERISRLRENHAIRDALSGIKRKALIGWYFKAER